MKHKIKTCLSLLCVMAMLVATLGIVPVSAVTGGGSAGTGSILAWGCDMSYYNTEGATDYSLVNYNLMKADGCEFVILRVGYEGSASRQNVLDESFVKLYNMAREAGMKIGVYFYALAKTYSGAVEDAQWCIDIFEQYDMYFDYPIYYDVEDPGNSERVSHESLTSSETTSLCLGWAETLEAAGYFPGVYAGYYVLSDLTSAYTSKYDTWIPAVLSATTGSQYNPLSDKTSYRSTYGMWQYKWYNEGGTQVYAGAYWKDSYGYPLDCNVAFKDYPTIIQNGGYNNMVTRHQIAYETNGGSAVSPSYVTDGQTLTQPESPTKYGFDFAGWYCNPELTDPYDFSTPVSYGFTLYAKWNEAYWGANTNLMPNSTQMQLNEYDTSGGKIWPYWNDDAYGSVTFYNAVSASEWSWPSAYMTYENSFDAVNDRYVYFKKEGNAYFNADITYMSASGELHTVKLSEVAGLTESDFAPGYLEYFVDLGGYIQSKGHMPASGNVKFTKVTYYIVGALDSYVRLYDMKLTPLFDIPDPYISLYDKNVQQLSGSGSYTYQNGVLHMSSTTANGYSVKFDVNKDYNPTEMSKLLMDITATTPFNISLEVTTAAGDATVELRKEFFDVFELQEAPEALPAGSWTPVMNMNGYYEWNGGIVSSSTIKSVTISLVGQGDLSLAALQVSRNDAIVYVNDGQFSSGSNTGSTVPNIITSSHYNVTTSAVMGLSGGTTVEVFLANIDQGAYVTVVDKNGNAVDAATPVATGMVAKLMDGSVVLKSYELSVKGDVNGDAAVSTLDVREILKQLAQTELTFSDLQKDAADFDSNSDITTADARAILKAIAV